MLVISKSAFSTLTTAFNPAIVLLLLLASLWSIKHRVSRRVCDLLVMEVFLCQDGQVRELVCVLQHLIKSVKRDFPVHLEQI